jgi:hypothetical protein
MRRLDQLGKLVLTGLIAAGALPSCGQIDPHAAGYISARIFAETYVTGLKVGILRSRREGKGSATLANCMLKLDATDTFGTIWQGKIDENFDRSERQTLDAFYTSPVGIKYAKQTVLHLYSVIGEPAPAPFPAFSASEATEFEQFRRTPAGDKLLVKQVMDSDSVVRALHNRALQAMASCDK